MECFTFVYKHMQFKHILLNNQMTYLSPGFSTIHLYSNLSEVGGLDYLTKWEFPCLVFLILNTHLYHLFNYSWIERIITRLALRLLLQVTGSYTLAKHWERIILWGPPFLATTGSSLCGPWLRVVCDLNSCLEKSRPDVWFPFPTHHCQSIA